VIKVEPPEGSPTRKIRPFLDDSLDPERSIFFWHYNRNKRSLALDVDTDDGRKHLMRLIEGADLLIDSSCGELNAWLGLDRDAIIRRFPGLVVARMTPFGDDGPWAKFKGSDLIHLALGGVITNCGYDPDPSLRYDLPPIAPQL
jgi:crotonobetainyl-CoA:carnitine CoA-transferase CaiB-like acyl-CoA transferase